MGHSSKHPISVSELNYQVRNLLEGTIGQIWLTGEVSNFSAPSSGHWYFTLKDDKSQIRCAMFRGRSSLVNFIAKNGQQVIVCANISVYEPRGDYQLIVETMQAVGVGLLQQQYEQLKQKLFEQGLFEQSHKKPIGKPNTIGIITSATGAALHDVLHVLARRAPDLEVIVYPTQVQGEAAPAQIINAINIAVQRNEVDAILLTRGGGSLEDLWCFNDEALAHAIYDCQLPIISAVGHEVDVTICDFVADLRAPTPSAGAEILSQDRQEQWQQLRQLKSRLWHGFNNVRSKQNQSFANLKLRLDNCHPQRRLNQQSQQLDELSVRLEKCLGQKLSQQQLALANLTQRLNRKSPELKLSQLAATKTQLEQRLTQAIKALVTAKVQHADKLSTTLNAVSPLNTLNRGYAIALDEQQKVIQDSSTLSSGDRIQVRLKQGQLEATVTQVKPD
ncbi:exodeoxyribonuclease VII large subunit [Paraferrimonas sp. SM1919]|uniref:exodeoxyribonuclease VII large subunit n=1 Tax=Paraferrimonas sp. SM1919 TaxID=2662263 RepID=UPI0013D77B77|nr:exodeoxyribonuclease VII large subunit [Paraferrimonas sp. SM1919]